ncbi:MAG TPA: hypothetical protein VHZ28_00565 [Terracidiphilus sp.]|nr:hypothetical protein [Terracidiphilus sp.]
MRVALKTVSNTQSTPDTTPSKSSGSSFLDILSQGTQDAVHETRAAGSQQQSDAPTSNHSSSDDAQSQEPSSSIQSSPIEPSAARSSASTSSTPVDPGTDKTPPAVRATNAAAEISAANQPGNPQTQQAASSAVQGSTTQNAAVLAALAQTAMANLIANDAGAAPASNAQASSSSTTSGVSSGKQTAPKGAQNKQPAATSATDLNTLQQALIALPQVVPVQDATPAQGKASQSGSLPLAVQTSLTDAVNQVVSQGVHQSQNANQLPAQADPTQDPTNAGAASAAQVQAPAIPPAAALQFGHDVAAAASTAAKSDASVASIDAATTAQVAAQQPAQSAHPNQAAQNQTTQNQLAQNQVPVSTFFAATVPPTDNSTSQASAKVVPFKISATNVGPSTNAPAAGSTPNSALNAAGTATAAKNASQDSSDSSSRDNQSGSDASLRSQTDNAQMSATAISNDASTQTFALNAATAHASTSTSTPSTSADSTPTHVSSARNLPADSANPIPASSAINTARVIQNMNETEMRVGMRSTEFGDISIRTMVNQQQMQTQISVDHSELVSALTAHIPAAQAKLGAEYGLHASIEVSQGGASFSNQQGQSSSQRDYKPFTPSMQFDGTASLAEIDRIVSRPIAAAVVAEGSRLDIRA